jgi:cyclophilin family peptidyl-prolyl cis-trans isomerase
MNTSHNTFVRIAIMETDHEAYGPHFINLEVYSKELPLSTKRFLSLCKGRSTSSGKNLDPLHPGYIGTICTRIQKGDFLQFGKIDKLPDHVKNIDDEHFIYDHSEPGMVGFVG